MREEDAYEYFSSPDMGSSEDFGARRSTRGGREERREKKQEIEEVPRGRSRSRSRSRTPSPQLVSPSSKADVLIPRSSSGSSLLPPTVRGRPTSPTHSTPSRGRSSTRTSSSLSDRGSPIGSIGSCSSSSLSPEGITSPGSAYANGRSNGRERERGRDRSGKRLNSSLSPGSPDPVDGTRVSLDAVAASAVADKNSSNSTINGNASDTTINTPVAQTGHNEVQAKTNGVPSGITKSRPVVAPSTPAPTSPTRTHAKSFSVSLPVVSTSTTPPSKSPEDSPIRRSPSSPSSPGHVKSSSVNALQHNLDHEGGIVGRAIDAVSHAGALLGLWHNHHHNHHATQGSQAH